MSMFDMDFTSSLLKMADMHIGEDGHVHPNDTSRKVTVVDRKSGAKFETTERRCREGRAFEFFSP